MSLTINGTIMNLGAVIDIATCGSDCYGQLNNPVAMDFVVIDETCTVKKEVSKLIRPEEPITKSAMIIHGISEDTLKNEDQSNILDLTTGLKLMYAALTKFKNNDLYLIGFNHISYDLEILNRHFEKVLNLPRIEWDENKIIDVMDLCMKAWDFRDIGNYNMSTCYYVATGIKNTLASEPANDNYMTMEILKSIMITKEFSTFDEVVKYIKEEVPFTVFTFGKYKGCDLDYVFKNDIGYIGWLSKNKDIQKRHGNLIKAIDFKMNNVN